MNDSSHTPDQHGQIKNSERAIFNEWGCKADFKASVPCGLPGISRQNVYVFNLPQPPAGHPTAKQCFAWRGVAFNPDWDANGEVVVLDVQVPDLNLPLMAVWAWWTNDLVNDYEADCISEIGSWTKEKILGLQNQTVFDEKGKTGKFFVRQWKDDKFLIRIVVRGILYPIQGVKLNQSRLKSVRLTQKDIETITEPENGSDVYRIGMSFPQR